ncbi:unnamed protein product [Musa textilis]
MLFFSCRNFLPQIPHHALYFTLHVTHHGEVNAVSHGVSLVVAVIHIRSNYWLVRSFLVSRLDLKNLYLNSYKYKNVIFSFIYLNVIDFRQKNNFNIPITFSMMTNGDVVRGHDGSCR